eukprot:gene6237-7750_t
MYLHALATAVPPTTLSQRACWDIVQRAPVRERLTKRSRLIVHSILNGDHGIATRHFAVPDIEHVFDHTADQLHHAFRAEAPKLAAAALATALTRAGLVPAQLDALAGIGFTRTTMCVSFDPFVVGDGWQLDETRVRVTRANRDDAWAGAVFERV